MEQNIAEAYKSVAAKISRKSIHEVMKEGFPSEGYSHSLMFVRGEDDQALVKGLVGYLEGCVRDVEAFSSEGNLIRTGAIYFERRSDGSYKIGESLSYD